MGEGQKKIKEGDGFGLCHAVGDYLRIAVEQGNQVRREYIDDDSHHFRCGNGTEDAEKTAPFSHPIVFSCPQILADECGEREGEAGYRKKAESFNFGVGSAACHGGGAETD